ncbi:hypothetical protein [Tumebacillus lipolyticus]|uniref:DUF2306 domain-containing protein n=1 Tax=Tumebacillus lipolyticus TaxID=1280370 RepID=A0ABW5A292_9BACL
MTIALMLHIAGAVLLSVYLAFPLFPRPLLHRVGHFALLVTLISGIWLAVTTRPAVWWIVAVLGLLLLLGAVLGKMSSALQKGQSVQRLKWVPAFLYLALLFLMV